MAKYKYGAEVIDPNDPIYANILEQAKRNIINTAASNNAGKINGGTTGLKAYNFATGTIEPAEKLVPTSPSYAGLADGSKGKTFVENLKKSSANKTSQSSASTSSSTNTGIINYGFKPAYQQSQAVINAANALAQMEANMPGAYRQSQAVIDALNTLAQYEAAHPGDYQQSQAVIDALNTLEQFEASRPGEYQSNYAEQIQGLLDQIINREAFTYDFASDPLYQMYADQYQQKGQMAMMDTMGQAAALSGGYGNTYAQNVGQQAYNAYLQELNNIIPELRNAAYQMYRDKGTEMYNQMGVLQGLEASDYGRYRDTVNDFLTDRDYLYGRYVDTRDVDYNRYRDTLNDYYVNRDYYYGKYTDISDDDYARYRDTVNDYFTNRGYYYNKYMDTSNMDYGRYRDSVGDYYADRDFSYRQAQDALAQANYQQELARQQEQYEREMAYQAERDATAQANYEQELAWEQEQYEREMAYQAEKDRIARENAAQELLYQQQQDALDRRADEEELKYDRYLDALAQDNWERNNLLDIQKAAANGVDVSPLLDYNSIGSYNANAVNSAPSWGQNDSGTYTDWTQLLSEVTPEERREILYGTSPEGKQLQAQLIAEVGETALNKYKRIYG